MHQRLASRISADIAKRTESGILHPEYVKFHEDILFCIGEQGIQQHLAPVHRHVMVMIMIAQSQAVGTKFVRRTVHDLGKAQGALVILHIMPGADQILIPNCKVHLNLGVQFFIGLWQGAEMAAVSLKSVLLQKVRHLAALQAAIAGKLDAGISHFRNLSDRSAKILRRLISQRIKLKSHFL